MKAALSDMALIGVCHLTWKRYLQEGLRDHGITLKQAYVLQRLAEKPFLRPAAIAELCFSDRPTATVVIRNLEKRGWVERQPEPDDGRQRRVVITPTGRAKLAELAARGQGLAVDPLACFDATERAMLGRLLRKLHGHLQDVLGGEVDDQIAPSGLPVVGGPVSPGPCAGR